MQQVTILTLIWNHLQKAKITTNSSMTSNLIHIHNLTNIPTFIKIPLPTKTPPYQSLLNNLEPNQWPTTFIEMKTNTLTTTTTNSTTWMRIAMKLTCATTKTTCTNRYPWRISSMKTHAYAQMTCTLTTPTTITTIWTINPCWTGLRRRILTSGRWLRRKMTHSPSCHTLMWLLWINWVRVARVVKCWIRGIMGVRMMRCQLAMQARMLEVER